MAGALNLKPATFLEILGFLTPVHALLALPPYLVKRNSFLNHFPKPADSSPIIVSHR